MTILHTRRVRQLPIEERLILFRQLQEALAPFPLQDSSEMVQKRIEVLQQSLEVKKSIQESPWLKKQILQLNLNEQHALYALLAIGEASSCLKNPEGSQKQEAAFYSLLQKLLEVEKLYSAYGGLIGYQSLALEQILKEQNATDSLFETSYKAPPGIDIRTKTPLIHQAILTALKSMHTMVELYVIGGAGERLKCSHPHTGDPLPPSLLPFGGKSSLLEWLLYDLKAREALAIKLTHRPFVTPVVLMTSRDNHEAVVDFCRKHDWFSRDPHSFFFIEQPLVPMLTEQGEWVIENVLEPLFKPPGHGTLWWQLQEAGLLESFQKRGIEKALVRQINNPFCGLDHGILAFLGLGLMRDKAFGFASCERKMGAPEGMNVLREHKTTQGSELCLTNIEYVYLKEKGIEETLGESNYSRFPANTNILFADLASIERALKKNPLPGLLLNMKTEVSFLDATGDVVKVHAGRLESTMQNIADAIVDLFLDPEYTLQWDSLSTYLTYNRRSHTLSVIKNAFCEGKDPFGTPPACFYELQTVLRQLLTDICNLQLPPMPSLQDYLNAPPPFYLQLSFRLGPLYSLISKKIFKGVIESGSHLVLELENLWMHNLRLQGSLQVYAEKEGSCLLENVTVRNQATLQEKGKACWHGEIKLKESCRIEIEESGAFYAKDLLIEGNITIHVPAGTMVTAYKKEDGTLGFKQAPITSSIWQAPLYLSEEGEISCLSPEEIGK